jgi:CRP-like cAMP-binding protein
MDNDIRKLVEQFFNSFPEVRYPKHQILFLPHENTDKVFLITEGRVCQYGISYRGDEVIVTTHEAPAIFPLATTLNTSANSFFYKTDNPTTIRVAAKKDFLQFLGVQPEVAYGLLTLVYASLESTLERLAQAMAGTARSRLMLELVTEFKRLNTEGQTSGHLDVTESGMAARLGLSRETVSREIKQLKHRHLVEVRANKVFVTNIAALQTQLQLPNQLLR